MSDPASKYTNKKIKSLDEKIQLVYSESQKDIEAKLDDFNKKFKAKYEIHVQEMHDGKITKEQFDSWVKGQVFQGNQWKAKRDQIINTITNSNQISTAIINGNMKDIFAANGNYMAYTLETGQGINFGFDIYDKTTVTKLIKDDPQLLPEWKIDEQKDYIWNYKKVNNAVTQGIIQGESLDKVAKRLTKNLVTQNENLMKTFARTAMTEAQNAGRDQRLMDAKAKGIVVVKQWMATLDARTRDSHAHMDGEKIKVGDKWHPMKFSNGCRFPGDPEGPPHEVYNCRCTLVGDVEEYPAEYERYDNIDGKPIENMTYKEWYKAKHGKEFEYTPKPASKGFDYDKYGGKEVVNILSKYNNWTEVINNTTPANYDEFQKVVDAFVGASNEEMDKIIKDIKAAGIKPKKTLQASKKAAKEATEEAKALKEYEKAKAELDKIEQEIKDKGADKIFEDIWKDQSITYADYEAKKHTIEAKKQFYEAQIKSLNDIGNKTGALLTQNKLDELLEFEKHGEEYSKLLAERKAAKNLANSLKPAPVPSKVFDPEAYTQERKNAAIWAKSPRDADKALREASGTAWKGATQEEKEAIYDYTKSYSKFNEPLRGWEYGESNYRTGKGFKGVGNTDLNAGYQNNGPQLNAMTDLLNKATLPEDQWFQRGCDYGGMDKFFNCDMSLLQHGTQKELEDALLGTTPTEFGFMSCGSSKGQGFSGDIILNVYAPRGSKAMYIEPISYYGGGAKMKWDGESPQSSLGGELETLFQQGTQFRVVKIERSHGTLYFDLDIIDQSNQQRWVP